MGLQFAQIGNNAASSSDDTNAGQQNQKDDRPAATEWLNVGIMVKVPNQETGEMEDTFIGLPFGIPLDTMSQARGNGFLAQAKNHVLEQVRETINQLAPGDAVMIDGLAIQGRRVNDGTATPSNSNPLLAALAGQQLAVVK